MAHWYVPRFNCGEICPLVTCPCAAQLKVNLRPLWSSAADALASLAQRFGGVVWRLVFGELQTVDQRTDVLPNWMGKTQETSDANEDPWEEERSWRDPGAHKLRKAVLEWLYDDDTRKRCLLVSAIPNQQIYSKLSCFIL